MFSRNGEPSRSRRAKGGNVSLPGSRTSGSDRGTGTRSASYSSDRPGRRAVRENHSLNAGASAERDRTYEDEIPSLTRRFSKMRATGPRIVVAVFGMTGTGKTTFIQKVSGQRLDVGHGLVSRKLQITVSASADRTGTSKIQEVTCKVGDYIVTLVDTPGFDDTTLSNTQVLELMAGWLQPSYDAGEYLTGIIYLHRISDNRMAGSALKNLRLFRKLCGDENMANVVLVTTRWDKVGVAEGEARERELARPGGFWAGMLASGCDMARHDGTVDGAVALVMSMMKNSPLSVKLQEELAGGKPLIKTSAGAFINEEIVKLRREHKQELKDLKLEMESAMKKENKALERELTDRYAKVVSDLEKRNRDQFLLQQEESSRLETRLKKERQELVKEMQSARQRDREAHEREMFLLARQLSDAQQEVASLTSDIDDIRDRRASNQRRGQRAYDQVPVSRAFEQGRRDARAFEEPQQFPPSDVWQNRAPSPPYRPYRPPLSPPPPSFPYHGPYGGDYENPFAPRNPFAPANPFASVDPFASVNPFASGPLSTPESTTTEHQKLKEQVIRAELALRESIRSDRRRLVYESDDERDEYRRLTARSAHDMSARERMRSIERSSDRRRRSRMKMDEQVRDLDDRPVYPPHEFG